MDRFIELIPVTPEWKAHAVAVLPILALALGIVITKLMEGREIRW